MAHIQLVRLLALEFLLLGLGQVVFVLDLRGALGDLSLAFYAVVGFIAAGRFVSST